MGSIILKSLKFGLTPWNFVIRFLEIALGSLFELQTQMVLSCYKEHIDKTTLIDLEDEIEELQKMISGFKNSLG